MEKIFYVYVDWTEEEVPRAFYVGKGNKHRVGVIKRNKYWQSIAKRYEHKREIILGTKCENYAFEIEKDLIFKYKTFKKYWNDGSGWGANFTEGGDGSSGYIPSKEQIKNQKIKMAGRKHTEESIEKMSGKNNHNYGKPAWNRGVSITSSSLEKRTKTVAKNGHWSTKLNGKPHPIKGKKHSQKSINKMKEIHSGEKNGMAKLTVNDVIKIKQMFLDKNYNMTEIAKLFNVNRHTIYSIKAGRCWKHISI